MPICKTRQMQILRGYVVITPVKTAQLISYISARMHNQAQGGASGTEDDRSHTSSATGTQGESCSPSQFEATLPSSFGKSTYGRGSDHPETSNDQRVEYTGLAMVESGND